MKRTPLNKISKRLSSGLYKYEKAKKEYLDEHPACEVCCKYGILQIHHRARRLAGLLWDKRYFLACCFQCHHKIESNPKWAMENGYTLDKFICMKKAYNQGRYDEFKDNNNKTDTLMERFGI